MAQVDGKEFDFYDEVPEHPHPNCKYYGLMQNLMPQYKK